MVILIAIVGVAAIAVLGSLAASSPAFAHRATAPLRHPWIVEASRRLVRTREHLVHELTPLGAYAAILAAGIGAIGALLWPLGKLAYEMGPFDLVVFEWLRARQIPGWADAMNLITQMGNGTETKYYVVIGSVVLALLAPHRRWVPPTIIVSVYVVEHFVQQALKEVVDRGHPPTTLGTWVSGGCARLVCVLGIILYLYFRYRPPSRRTLIAGWTVLAALAYVEGYTRAYTLRHWLTDVFGGWLFGALLLLLMIVATQALDRPWNYRRARPPTARSGDRIALSRLES